MTDPAADFSAPAPAPDDDGPRDFSAPVKPVEFTMDRETFHAPRIVAPVNVGKLAAVFTDMQVNDNQWIMQNMQIFLPRVAECFRLLVPGPGGQRIAARLMADGSDPELVPLDIVKQVMPLLMWLMEQLGLRPTQPSQPSTDGSTEATTDTTPSDAISSTDGVSLEA